MIFVANELKQLLLPLSRIVATKDTTENGDKFIFDGKKVYAFNGEIFACQELETDFQCAVVAETLFKMISKYDMNEIEIDMGDDGFLHVKKGTNDTTFNIEEEFECPLSTKKVNWAKLPEEFANAITVCSYTTGNDFTEIRGVCVHVEGSVVESTDSTRVTQYFLDGEVDDEMFIPKTLIKYIGQINPVEYAVTKDWLYFRNSSRVTMAFRKTVVKDYYDLQEIVDSHMEGKEIVLPDKVVDALEKAEIVLTNEFEGDRFVTIKAKKGKLIITGKGNGGHHKSQMKVKFDDEVSFEVNPRSMIEMLINGNTLILNEDSIVMETENAVLLTTLMVN